MVKLSQLVRRYTAKKATSLAGGMSYVVDTDQYCSYCRTLQLGAGQRKHAFKPYEPGSQDDVGSQADGQPRNARGRFGAAHASDAGTTAKGCDRFNSEGAKVFREGDVYSCNACSTFGTVNPCIL